MTAQPYDFQAGLIFTDDSDVSVDQLTGPMQQAFATFGEAICAEPEIEFDRVMMFGASYVVETTIFDAPEADPDTHRMIVDEMPNLDPTVRTALENPTFWIHVSIRPRADATGGRPAAAQAMLAEMVHHFAELTGAPFVQWLDRETIIPAARFQASFTPIRYRQPQAAAPERRAVPRRVRPQTSHRGYDFPEPAATADAMDDRFAAMQDAAALAMNDWIVYRDEAVQKQEAAEAAARPKGDLVTLADVFRTDPVVFEGEPGTERQPIEARLATWTVNATVAVIAPPVGAALLTYNAIRGEDFRLSAHALTLCGAFIGLGATEALSNMMPF